MLTKADMQEWIKTAPPKRLGNALVSLYDRQTFDEKSDRSTKHKNNVGFNGADAPTLTGIAKWFKDKGFLTPKQAELVRIRIIKYSGQLAEIANIKNAQRENNG